MLGQKNHADGGAYGINMVGMFVRLCFASQPSERKCFVPARKDLAVKLLT